MCVGSGVVVRKTVADMSHLWDPPDPGHGRSTSRRGRSNRSVGIVLLVVTALVAGGAVSYVLSQWQDSRSGASALPTAAPTTSTTSTSTTATTARPTTTTVAASSCDGPDIGGCQRTCILRISSLKKNYDRCDSACNGDQCAENICKKTARDIACEAIRARCTSDGDNVDIAFRACCGTNCPTLDDVDEELCKILPTTTTSSTTTSSSLASTTSTTTTTLGTVLGIFGWGN